MRSFRLNHSGIDVVRTAPFADVFRDELEAELFRDDGIFGPCRRGDEDEEGKKEGDAFHGVAGAVGIVHKSQMFTIVHKAKCKSHSAASADSA